MGTKFSVDVYDGVGLVGFALLEYGIACWSTPAAWVLGGVALMAYAIRPYVRLRKGTR